MSAARSMFHVVASYPVHSTAQFVVQPETPEDAKHKAVNPARVGNDDFHHDVDLMCSPDNEALAVEVHAHTNQQKA